MKKHGREPGPVLIDTPIRLAIMESLFAAMGLDFQTPMMWAERWADDKTVELVFGHGPDTRPVIRVALTPAEARQVAGWLHPRDEG